LGRIGKAVQAVQAVRRSGGDRLHDLVDGGVGQGGHLVVGAVLDGVGDEHPGRVEAERSGLSDSGVDEFSGRDEDAGEATTFEISDVVHTARRAAASVRKRLDDHVARRGDLVFEVDWCDLGERRLAEARHS